ncbi:unnamed protein product [Somion occarium]|uniref:Mitochondrial escape protein 2 n=1 Tax=Somion occarium TaxID=3059160 RepID=A0ABP1DAK3_9APHY
MSLSKGTTNIAWNVFQVVRRSTKNSSAISSQLNARRSQARYHSEVKTTTNPEESATSETPAQEVREGWLFVDSVFPVRIGSWDVRYYIGIFREETLLGRLGSLFEDVQKHGFHVVSLEPQKKDGGVFVKFKYNADDSDAALNEILSDLRVTVEKHGGVPSWLGLPRGNVWLVKGQPWREDLMRYPSPLVKIAFDGPDVDEESLYSLLRPYGRIRDFIPPSPAPAGTLRSTIVTYRNLRAAVRARNTIHGLILPSSPSATTKTRLKTSYQQPIQAHAVRDYVTSHPRIFLPILFFLLGTLTYTIFDPIRALMVEGKMNNWFDFRQFRIYKWLRDNTVQRFSFSQGAEGETPSPKDGAWKERLDAQDTLERYLSDMPNTVAFIHGPQGSGKTRMLTIVLQETGRKALVIDVAELSKATTETALVTGLARQTGYWPVFSFMNSMNNLIDLASVGLIGQKTGLSSSLSDQLKQILEVVGTGLRHVNATYKEVQEKQRKREHLEQLRKEHEAQVRERIREGIWHDGRLDVVAGVGVMSELGIGDEWFSENDADFIPRDAITLSTEKNVDEAKRKQRNTEDLQAIESMPIVIIKNFETKGRGTKRDELLDVLAQWAASLAENQVAHVVVVSANRENAKRLARALPSKPLTIIALSDADNASALSFVKQKLHDVGIDIELIEEQVHCIEKLGGRASDLESLIHKVRSGQSVEEAVEDIVTRGVSELRKNAFGDDLEDAKNLPWAREQAWTIMKQLADKSELPYHDLLLDFPFKGDETALRNMEQAELISIATRNGRPSTIRPGKPVYRYVFKKLVHDPIFQATQDIAFNTKLIAASETIIRTCEQELLTLREIDAGTSTWWGPSFAVKQRREHLLKNMHTAENKIEVLEKQNINLKKILAKAT